MNPDIARRKRTFILVLFAWLLLSTALNTVLNWSSPVSRAILGMSWGLIILWVIIAGGLMYRFRDVIRVVVEKIPLQWQVRFAIFAVTLALLEEAVTTMMTNLAPLFGVSIGEAYITASTNYWDVIFFHSVIIFVGPLIFWSLVLRRYDFSPFAVFLIFGISGTLAETSIGGPLAILGFGQWIFIYGLMIFLPAYTIPPADVRGARPPKWYHYALMVVLPVALIPFFAFIPHIIDPDHPQPTHFAPIEVHAR